MARRASGPFVPGPFTDESFARELDAMVRRLAPDSVDEGTPHVLDNFINAWADVQVAQVLRERADYEDDLVVRLVAAAAESARHAILNERDQMDLHHMRIALDAAVARALGVAQPPPVPAVP